MQFDVVIIGGGPGGSSAALALAGQGRSVALVERAEFPRRKVCGEFMSAVNFDLFDRLGVGQEIRGKAGPAVRRVALFGSGEAVFAPMPNAAGEAHGHALGRDVLDGILLDAARSAGVAVFQPWRATGIEYGAAASRVIVDDGTRELIIEAPVVIAAHGSWETGRLPSNLEKSGREHDFLGFKAHFHGARMPTDLMPLVAFPGGYGGMVWADRGRLSLSCCVQRDWLAEIRGDHPGIAAGEAVGRHIVKSCPAVAEALAGAETDGAWLAAGPIRPGIREAYRDGIFRVGNLAGEAHPVIAEGISMALQSGWLLAEELAKIDLRDPEARRDAGRRYGRAWRRQFATRIRLASALGHLAVWGPSAARAERLARMFPSMLSLGARVSGKTKALPRPAPLRGRPSVGRSP